MLLFVTVNVMFSVDVMSCVSFERDNSLMNVGEKKLL